MIAATLSSAGFGILELILTTVGLLGLVMNCGLNNAVQRYYWDKDTQSQQRPSIVSSGMAMQLFFGSVIVVFGVLLLYFFYENIYVQKLPLTWVALISALLLMFMSQWSQYILDVTRLHFSPWRFITISLISRIGSAFLGLFVVVYLGWGIDGFLSAQVLAILFVIPLALYLIRKDLTFKVEASWATELVRFGYPFIFAGLAYWLFGSMDRWMLAAFSSLDEVGVYSVSFRFASIVLLVSGAFSQAWSPIAMKIRTDAPDSYRSIYANVLLLLMFLMFLMFLMLLVGGVLALFSGEVIGLIMTKEYMNSALPLSILCFGIVLQATQQVTAIGISIEKKTFLFARLAWITALVNFILNWLLIPKYGAVGAAWATTASYLVLTGSYLYYTQKLHALPISWKRLNSILFLATCVCLVSVNFNNTDLIWSIVGIKIVFIVILFFIGWFILPIRSLKFAS